MNELWDRIKMGSSFKKKISIVVPVRNCRTTIKNLLDSLMELNYPKDKIEIIVVDGNSTDGTREVLENYPIKILDEPGLGLNYARNLGFKNSTGEIIALTDGDCIVPEDWATNILKDFEDESIGIVGGTIVTGNPENIYARYINGSIIPVMPTFEKKLIFEKAKLPHYPIGCNMAFRREVLEMIDGFDSNFKTGFDEVDTLERIGKTTDFR
ncbi:MAG: glycosyltransferase, partial [Candidatus Bathyarchaeia archaeon]